MIKIVRGKYGPQMHCAGSVISLDEASEKRLVERKVAIYVEQDRVSDTCIGKNITSESINQDDKVNTNLEIDAKSEEELNKMRSKKEIIDYANSIGLEGLNEELKKDELVNSIINYIEENFDLE